MKYLPIPLPCLEGETASAWGTRISFSPHSMLQVTPAYPSLQALFRITLAQSPPPSSSTKSSPLSRLSCKKESVG